MNFFGNDTIALLFLGLIAIFGLFFNNGDAVNIALGAIGGYIGSKVVDNATNK